MKVSIYLSKKRKNKEKKSPIYFRISHLDKRSEFSTGIFVEEKHFSTTKKLVTTSHEHHETFNRQIIQLHAKVLDIIYNLKTIEIDDPSTVKEVLSGDKKIEVSGIHRTLPPFIEWCRKYVELKYQIKFNTNRIYSDAINYLQKYEQLNKVTIHRIDNKLAKQVIDFFTVNKRLHYMSKIKFLSKEYHNNFDLDNPIAKYRIINKDKYTKGALTKKDLSKIINFEPNNNRSKIFHDVFLFQYYSAGARVGDVLNLKWADINGDYLKRVEEKTGKERYIPLNNNTKAILNRNKGNNADYVFDLGQLTPPFNNREWCQYKYGVISNMNSYLKTLRNSLDIKVNISTHTSRHTFATHSFEKTKDIKSTSLMIGHSKLATTEMYVHAENILPKKMFEKVYQD